MTKEIATARIYLGSPFYTPAQRERVLQAKALLAKNATVAHVTFPFDQNFVDSAESVADRESGRRSVLWQQATYQNDLAGISHATCGVFLYDLDRIDDGSAFEIGFFRAQHKPVILVPFRVNEATPKGMNLMLAQGVTTLLDGNTEFARLATFDFNETPANPVSGYQIY